MVEGRGETFQLVVFSSYKIEKCAPYRVEIIARLGRYWKRLDYAIVAELVGEKV